MILEFRASTNSKNEPGYPKGRVRTKLVMGMDSPFWFQLMIRFTNVLVILCVHIPFCVAGRHDSPDRWQSYPWLR